MGNAIFTSGYSLYASGYNLLVGVPDSFALGIWCTRVDGLVGLQYFMHMYIYFVKLLGCWMVAHAIVVSQKGNFLILSSLAHSPGAISIGIFLYSDWKFFDIQ